MQQKRIWYIGIFLILILLTSSVFAQAVCPTREELREKIREDLEARKLRYDEKLLDKYVAAVLPQEEVPPSSAERGFTTIETLLAFNPLTAPFYWGYKGVKAGVEWWQQRRDVTKEKQMLALSLLETATDYFLDNNFRDLAPEQLVTLKSKKTAQEKYDYLTKELGWTADRIAIRAGGLTREEILIPRPGMKMEEGDFYQEFEIKGTDKIVQIKDIKKHHPLPGKSEREIKESTKYKEASRFIANTPQKRMELVREAYELYIKNLREDPQTSRIIELNKIVGYSNNKKATRIHLKIIEVRGKIIIHGYPVE